MAFIVLAGFPATSIISTFVISPFGWRPMSAIASIGTLIVWYLRRHVPERPRWPECNGRVEEAQALLERIAGEMSRGRRLPLPQPPVQLVESGFGSLFGCALGAAGGR